MSDMETHLREQELQLIAENQQLQREVEDRHRVIAVLLEALGGSYTITHKQLEETDWNPVISRQDNFNFTVTFAVRKEEPTWQP